MSRFDRTQSAYIERKIDEQTRYMQIGEVVEVFEHTSDADTSNFEVSLILRDEDQERRRIPVMTPRNGEISPPEVGDNVVVAFLDGQSEYPIVIGNIYNSDDRAPLGRAGLYRLTRGSLYVEAHEEGEYARIAKKPADDGTASTKIEVDDSGSTTSVNIETDGDINISAGGNVVIDEGGTAKNVLTEDAVFEYEQRVDTSDGTGGTTTQTTSPVSNGEVTDTEIQ